MKVAIEKLADCLHGTNASCVIASADGSITVCRQRGVKDLLEILDSEPGKLLGAMVADKVVGKGAAALMIAGGVSGVYADVISQPALELFTSTRIPVVFITRTDRIENRAKTGLCPVESLCAPCLTASECLPLIREFVRKSTIQTK